MLLKVPMCHTRRIKAINFCVKRRKQGIMYAGYVGVGKITGFVPLTICANVI